MDTAERIEFEDTTNDDDLICSISETVSGNAGQSVSENIVPKDSPVLVGHCCDDTDCDHSLCNICNNVDLDFEAELSYMPLIVNAHTLVQQPADSDGAGCTHSARHTTYASAACISKSIDIAPADDVTIQDGDRRSENSQFSAENNFRVETASDFAQISPTQILPQTNFFISRRPNANVAAADRLLLQYATD